MSTKLEGGIPGTSDLDLTGKRLTEGRRGGFLGLASKNWPAQLTGQGRQPQHCAGPCLWAPIPSTLGKGRWGQGAPSACCYGTIGTDVHTYVVSRVDDVRCDVMRGVGSGEGGGRHRRHTPAHTHGREEQCHLDSIM